MEKAVAIGLEVSGGGGENAERDGGGENGEGIVGFDGGEKCLVEGGAVRGGEMLVEQRVEGEALEALAEDVRAGGGVGDCDGVELGVRRDDEADEVSETEEERGGKEIGGEGHDAVEEEEEDVVVEERQQEGPVQLQEERDGFDRLLQHRQLPCG